MIQFCSESQGLKTRTVNTLTGSEGEQPRGQEVSLFQFKSKGGKRDQQKVLATKHTDLGLIPEAHKVE